MLPGFNSNEEGTARQQLLVVQQHSSRLVLLFCCCIHGINFLVCLRSFSQPSSYKNPCPPTTGYPKARRPERGLLALFVRSSYRCMRRSKRPCRVCTSFLLTAGAPILLLSSEIGFTANSILFIPTYMTPDDASGKVCHLEFYIERIPVPVSRYRSVRKEPN